MSVFGCVFANAEGDLDRVVEGDRLADLLAGSRGVVLLVDRGALHLQVEVLRVLPEQEIDGLLGHRRQARLVGGPLILLADLRGGGNRVVSREALPFEAHVALVEEARARVPS